MCVCLVGVNAAHHDYNKLVTGTWESYSERMKTWAPFMARTVVITEKFVGKDEPGGGVRNKKQQSKAQSQRWSPAHTCTVICYISARPYWETAVWWVHSAESSCRSWMTSLSPLVHLGWRTVPPPGTHPPCRLTGPVFWECQLDLLRRKMGMWINTSIEWRVEIKPVLQFDIWRNLHRPPVDQTQFGWMIMSFMICFTV